MGTRAHQTKAVERLLSWLQQREDQMAALLADLIAIPTENPPGRQYREFVEVLEKQTERLGLAFRRLEPPSRPGAGDDVPECLSASHGQGAPFYFHGHYDVVPAQSEKQFQPQRKDHFVFGRGASDMKGGIVSMLYAIVGLKECGVEIEGKINLVLVPDEETGGARGSARLAEQGIPGGNGVGMLLAEPTSGVVWNALLHLSVRRVPRLCRSFWTKLIPNRLIIIGYLLRRLRLFWSVSREVESFIHLCPMKLAN